MDGRSIFRMGCIAGLWAVCTSTEIQAESVELRRSWRSDAALHDVQQISAKHAWAVGDQGALWQTADGGQTWSLTDTGSDASFRSVCLLTDQIGWIAGWRVQGSAELATGVLLATRDGGQSWQAFETKSLSPLRHVRFFGLEEGLVIGEPTPENSTGVWITSDGGQTWQPVTGSSAHGWSAAALVSPELGLLADRAGGVSLLAGPQLLPSKLPMLNGRTIRGVAMSGDHHAWLVGDGGLVLHSPSGGVVWEDPAGRLPDGLRHVSDFQAVAMKDQAVWIAGNPGGIIWHSPDGGTRWIKQPTGSATPLNKLHFVNSKQGCAVGELGVILTTTNGGETWTVAQGAGRRAALLSIHPRVENLAPELVAKLSGEQGFRSAAVIAIRPRDAAGPLSIADRVSAAMTTSGGAAGSIAWQLPLDVPGLELNSAKLLDQWQRKTEGQLPQTLLGSLVRQIRVWRPTVLMIDQPAPEDAAAQLIYDAALKAVEQAGDATRFVIQREFGGLSPWKVERVYLQLLPGSAGELAIAPYEFLPRWQTSARLASAPARALLTHATNSTLRRTYRAIDLAGTPSPQGRGSDFFAGLALTPGADVRRELIAVDERRLDQQIKAAQRHRNFVTHAEKAFDDPRVAGQMLAQLKDVTQGMTPEQAAQTLCDLFEEHRRRGRFDLAEATGFELVRKYPDQPVTADVARWLLLAQISEEVAWRKVRQLKSERRNKPSTAPEPIRQASHQAQFTHLPELKERLKKGQMLWQHLETHWPRLAQSPEIQFPLAAMHRARGSLNLADGITRRWIHHADETDTRDWAGVGQREVWLTQQGAEVPGGIAGCYRTTTKPQLDGLLSDECWQEAREWTLAFRSPAAMPDVAAPLVMLAYDDEYLYVAASVKRMDGQAADQPRHVGRAHDADLRRHDRITIRFDTDRDYATWYEFQIDQRGSTAESCWSDAGWNPQWYVAADGDTAHWRVELAIPWAELSAKRPEAGAAWGLSLERTAPAVGQQFWTPPPSSQLGSSFGILRFE